MASSSIRQPEDVLISVAPPRAGLEVGACESGVQALARAARSEYDHPDADRQRSDRRGADEDETTRRTYPARLSLRLDARSEGGRRLDPVHGALRRRNRTLLLAKPIGELRRRSNACLESGTTLGR